jgi:hypothetical protein
LKIQLKKDLKSGEFDSRRGYYWNTEKLKYAHKKMADAERLKRDFRKRPGMTCPEKSSGM